MVAHPVSHDESVYLKGFIREIPDFPIPGIKFKDITPLLADPTAFSTIIGASVRRWKSIGIDQVVAVESRGFILGAPLAQAVSAGLILVRKPGKLPGERDRFDYTCEYCNGQLEVHSGLVQQGARCLVIDDLLATGGTARATADYLLSKGASIVGYGFLVELSVLRGRALLTDAPMHSVMTY